MPPRCSCHVDHFPDCELLLWERQRDDVERNEDSMSVLQLLKASRPKVIPVELSVGTVFITEMNGHQFELVQRSMRKDPETGEQNTITDAQLGAMVLCEEDGRVCFPTPEAGVPELLAMKAVDLRKIAVAALRSAGLLDSKDDVTEKEKNS